MSRRDGANAVLFVEKTGPLLCHLRAPIVPKLGTHSYGQNLISIELNPYRGILLVSCTSTRRVQNSLVWSSQADFSMRFWFLSSYVYEIDLDQDRRVNVTNCPENAWKRGRHAHALGRLRWRRRREVHKNVAR